MANPCDKYTPEEIEDLVALVRVLVGDVPASIFYPVLSDEEILTILYMEKCNVKRAARRVAMSIAFFMSTTSYKERTGNIEVINNASLQYQKVLSMFLTESGYNNLPDDIVPYAAGISVRDICASRADRDLNRSPLAQITPCLAWWTDVKNYYSCSTYC